MTYKENIAHWIVRFTLGLAIILLGFYLTMKENCLDLQCRYLKLVPTVGKIYTQLDGGGSLGTGTYIAPHYLLTAQHVVEGDDGNVHVSTLDGIYAGKVVYTMVRYDMAIIYTPYYAGNTVEMSSENTMEVGDDVITIGSPAGLTGTLGKGHISAPMRKDPLFRQDVIQYTAQNFHGNSGGALFNTRNELIGVVSYYRGDPFFMFAYDITQARREIKTFIAMHEYKTILEQGV